MKQKHLSPEQLSEMVDGRLSPDAIAETERHLAGCPTCRDALAALSDLDAGLAQSLDHDPGDAYFDSFADRVTKRIGSGERAIEKESPFARFGHWISMPKNIALVGGVGAVVIGVGFSLLVTERPVNDLLRKSGLEARSAQQAPAAPAESGEKAKEEAAPPPVQHDFVRDAEPGAVLGLTEEAAKQAMEFRAERARGGDTAGARSDLLSRAYQVRRDAATGEDVRVGAAPALPRPANEAAPSTVSDAKRNLRAQPLGSAETEGKLRGQEIGTVDLDQRESGRELRLCGEVKDATGRPLRFASVSLMNRNVGSQTDDHGRFCLIAAPGRDTLVVQLLGFRPRHIGVNVGRDPDLAIRLESISAIERAVSSKSALAKAAPVAPAPRLDAAADLPDTARKVAELAIRLSDVASRSNDARQHEAAALQWERLLPFVTGGKFEVETRGRIAEERYHAWEAEPDWKRAVAAREALTSFLVRAPIGPERNRATLWLDKVAK